MRDIARYNGVMPIRMIALDLDGTLLDKTSHVPEENARVVAQAAARGVEIVIVTGRRFDFARPATDLIPCDLHLIVNNGALIKSKEGRTHQRHLLPAGTARKVLKDTPEYRAGTGVIFDRPRERQVILEKVDWDDPFRGGYFRRNRDYIAEVSPLTDCLNGDDPIQVMYSGPCVEMRSAKTTLESLDIAADYTLALTEYEARDFSILDVLRRGVSKGVALAEWARRRGIPREEVMAIGDNWNDREMLDFAGFPVVMGNAVPELKLLGYAVTISNNENGVAEAIRRYVLESK